MKSHDHHVMLQHILPIGVHNLLHLGPRKAIIRLGRSFRKLCTKVLNVSDIPNLRTYVVETLCMLKIWWPSAFTTKYVALYPHTKHQISDANEEEEDVGEVLSGNGVLKMLSSLEMEIIYEYVISNLALYSSC
jgi:hypothetical protein